MADLHSCIGSLSSESKGTFPPELAPLAERPYDLTLEELDSLKPSFTRNTPQKAFELYSAVFINSLTFCEEVKLTDAQQAIGELKRLSTKVAVSEITKEIISSIMNSVCNCQSITELIQWLNLIEIYEKEFEVSDTTTEKGFIVTKLKSVLMSELRGKMQTEEIEEITKQLVEVESCCDLKETKNILVNLAIDFVEDDSKSLDKRKEVVGQIKALQGLQQEYLNSVQEFETQYGEVPVFNVEQYKKIKSGEAFLPQAKPSEFQEIVKSIDDIKHVDTLYTNKRSTGEGVEIWKASLNSSPGTQVAVKIYITQNNEEIKSIQNEIGIMKFLSGKRNLFLDYYGGFTDQVTKESKTFTRVGVVMELCEKNLTEVINERAKANNPYNEQELWSMFRDLVDCFAFLHTEKIFHNDIKPDNIFMKEGNLKVGDFNISKHFQGATTVKLTRDLPIMGTVGYMAPEIEDPRSLHKANPQRHGDTTEVNMSKVDVYSLGITFLQIYSQDNITGLNTRSKQQELQRIIQGVRYDWLKRLLGSMLSYEKESRPTMVEVTSLLDLNQGTYAKTSANY